MDNLLKAHNSSGMARAKRQHDGRVHFASNVLTYLHFKIHDLLRARWRGIDAIYLENGECRGRSKPRPEQTSSERGTPEILPRPDFRFPGEIGRTYLDSDPAQFPKMVAAPEGAPNILLILIDDCGFGQYSTFGGGIPSPTMDKLAAEGLRYNRFHTTALCSPTRAALITGRNHHSASFAGITELATGYDGYT